MYIISTILCKKAIKKSLYILTYVGRCCFIFQCNAKSFLMLMNVGYLYMSGQSCNTLNSTHISPQRNWNKNSHSHSCRRPSRNMFTQEYFSFIFRAQTNNCLSRLYIVAVGWTAIYKPVLEGEFSTCYLDVYVTASSSFILIIYGIYGHFRVGVSIFL